MGYLMSSEQSIDSHIAKIGFWSIITAFVMLALSLFFPLGTPEGYAASHAERVAWLSANGSDFIIGWTIQIVWMSAWCTTMFVLAWKIASTSPIRAVVAAMVVLVSFIAFIIPKFMAIWTLPQLADAVVHGGAGADMANALLLILNQSIPFSLFTSFDYLGFWMYAVFALIVACPLYQCAQQSLSLKICAIVLGAFGLLLHGMIFGVFAEIIGATEIHDYVGPFFMMIFFAFGAAAIYFKGEMA